MCPGVIEFLQDLPKVEASSQALMAIESSRRSNWSQVVPPGVTGLHLAAYFGLQEAVYNLLQDRKNRNQGDSWRRTPLVYAAKNGHAAVVKLLLAMDNIDADARDDEGRTPLWYAVKGRHKSVVELLLATDKVDVKTKHEK